MRVLLRRLAWRETPCDGLRLRAQKNTKRFPGKAAWVIWRVHQTPSPADNMRGAWHVRSFIHSFIHTKQARKTPLLTCDPITLSLPFVFCTRLVFTSICVRAETLSDNKNWCTRRNLGKTINTRTAFCQRVGKPKAFWFLCSHINVCYPSPSLSGWLRARGVCSISPIHILSCGHEESDHEGQISFCMLQCTVGSFAVMFCSCFPTRHTIKVLEGNNRIWAPRKNSSRTETPTKHLEWPLSCVYPTVLGNLVRSRTVCNVGIVKQTCSCNNQPKWWIFTLQNRKIKL